MSTSRRIKGAIAVLAMASIALTACSNSESDSEKKVDTASSAAAAASETNSMSMGADSVMMMNPYVRSIEDGKSMTGIFGEIMNHSDKDVTVVGFSSSINAKMNQLHEVVDGVMKEKEGGFVIPAGGTYTLEPGKDHMMLMGVDKPVVAGDTVSVTLELSDGTTVDVKDIPVRKLGAGDENYGADGAVHMDHGTSDTMKHDHSHK